MSTAVPKARPAMGRSSPAGSAPPPGQAARGRRDRGFTYVVILLAVAFLGIALAAVGTVWALAARREREAELLFVGDAYRSAIAHYYASGPGAHRFPEKLEDLVEDRRVPLPRRHLRRIYPDPMTGRADWQLIRDPEGGIAGVSSSSPKAPVKRANFQPPDDDFAGAECYCDWKFEYTPARRFRRPRDPAASPTSPVNPTSPTSSPTSPQGAREP
jgi:type II secretory pathway pseudopilin PulG